ncbi:MAG: glycoside hydrolase family 3 C-terminal domain-containing protein [Bacteroidales bacterium]|nr:glycoside hydrolase family 3 C-terminal domain-containing protein [Bacteroidales bacterium]
MKKLILLHTCLFYFTISLFAQLPVYLDPERSTSERVEDLIRKMTLEEKIDLLAGYNDFYLHPCERLGIPAFKLADGPLGIASWGLFGRATAFPSALSSAASWNRELLSEAGKIYAKEWRSRGIHFMLAPGVNIYRASKGARNFEYYGEDPYLTSELVIPFIRSVQEGGVIATVKYYAANDQEYDRYSVSSEVDERTLHEIYLPPFKAAVQKAGIHAVMTGYNPVNGVYNTQNKFLIDILKKDWDFKGMLMSDWACTYSAIDAANNGLDLEMGSKICFNREVLLPLIKEGKIEESTIDDKVRRIYGACIEMGFFDREQKTNDPVYNPEANAMALKMAREGIILLKNSRHFLPLDQEKVKTIAVIGPTANSPVISDRLHKNNRIIYGGGGSSKVNPWHIVSDLEGIKNQFSNATVLYDEGISNDFKPRLFTSSVFYTPEGNRGLTGQYFGNDSIQPVKTQTDRQIDFQWWGSAIHRMELPEDFKIVWEGYILPEKTDEIIFFVDAQGGYRLWMDDRLILDAASSQSFDNRYYSEKVNKGEKKNIRLEYYSHKSSPAEIRFGYTYKSNINFSEPLKIARAADVVIFCAGLDGAIELEGRDRPFELPYGQDSLINEIMKVNPNLCIIIHAGGGIDMSQWIDKVPATLHALYAGQEGGTALAEILAGKVNPSAKLPFTIEKKWEDSPAYGNYDETRASKKVFYNEGIFVGYRGYDKKDITPLFPFGFGLSYTTFDYSGLKINKKQNNSVEISFRIKNTGKYEGAEIAQVYIKDRVASEERPLKELKGFEKIRLKPGEEAPVTITLSEEDFSFYSSKHHQWIFEKGEFDIKIGRSSRDIVLEETVKL